MGGEEVEARGEQWRHTFEKKLCGFEGIGGIDSSGYVRLSNYDYLAASLDPLLLVDPLTNRILVRTWRPEP